MARSGPKHWYVWRCEPSRRLCDTPIDVWRHYAAERAKEPNAVAPRAVATRLEYGRRQRLFAAAHDSRTAAKNHGAAALSRTRASPWSFRHLQPWNQDGHISVRG